MRDWPCIQCGASDRYRSGGCKQCHQAKAKAARAADPDKFRQRGKAFYERHAVALKQKQVEYRTANPKKCSLTQRNAWLKYTYGINSVEYERMLAAQDGVCAICLTRDPGGRPNKFGEKHFHVDHCHRTGAVRGLLCCKCNQGLGAFGDDPDVLDRAVAYVRARQSSASKDGNQR